MTSINADLLNSTREKLLVEIVDYFSSDPDVPGIFLGGALPAGNTDHFSDIDLRVVVPAEDHGRFVAARQDLPKK